MNLENIKKMLGDAWTDEVETAITSLVQEKEEGGSNYVPKEKYNSLKEAYNSLNAQAEAFQTADAEKTELQTKLSQLQDAYGKLEQESSAKLADMRNEFMFEKELATYNPRNAKAVSALIDKAKLQFSENGVEGLKEQIDALRESDGFLFKAENAGTGMPNDAVALQKSTSPLEDEQLRKYFGLEAKK